MKRLVSAALAAVLILSLASSAMASDSRELAADTLYTLELLEGTGSGYELERTPTRAEALVFVLRLSGLKDEAESADGICPFTDVPAWAAPYVRYAYDRGLVHGIDAEHFGPDMPVRDKDFFSLLLRAMGYSEEAGDFSWALSSSAAVRLGIAQSIYTDFDRGAMFECALAALTCRMKDQELTLIDKLVAGGDVERARAAALGLSGARPLTAREISERYTSAVVLLECFDSSASIISRTPDSNSSGFFISADGLLVTNYHTIDEAIYAVVTLDNGEQYQVERVLFYNAEIDAAVVKVSQSPMGDGEKATFPYLNMLSTETVHIGDTVYALGNPLGLQNSLSSGIISNNQRLTSSFALPMLQNTASISKGSSGGALFNEYGYVIGITSGYFSYGQDMYLAVPIDAVMDADLTVEGLTLPELAKLTAQQKTA